MAEASGMRVGGPRGVAMMMSVWASGRSDLLKVMAAEVKP